MPAAGTVDVLSCCISGQDLDRFVVVFATTAIRAVEIASVESLHLPVTVGAGIATLLLLFLLLLRREFVRIRPPLSCPRPPCPGCGVCFLSLPGVDWKPGLALVSSFVILNTKTVEVSLFPSVPCP